MNRQQALRALLFAGGVSAKEYIVLLERYGSPERLVHAMRLPVPDEALSGKSSLIRIIDCLDPGYPIMLNRFTNMPAVLSIIGSIEDRDSHAIAIVGTRNPTAYGMKAAYSISKELAQNGITVVSGLARGVDTAAHRGALDGEGRTIAVVGSGLNRIYPAENRALADLIQRRGAVVSEYGEDAEPKRYNFPKRNRIVSGLSQAVLLIEAPEKSGSMLTLEGAAKQNLPVLCLPGNRDNRNTQGNIALLEQGKAMQVDNAQEILEFLKHPQQFQHPSYQEVLIPV